MSYFFYFLVFFSINFIRTSPFKEHVHRYGGVEEIKAKIEAALAAGRRPRIRHLRQFL